MSFPNNPQGQGACFTGLSCTKILAHGSLTQEAWSSLIFDDAINIETAKPTQFRLIFQSQIFISDYKKN